MEEFELLQKIKPIIKQAGTEVLKYYKKNTEINYKEDLSPVTEADLASHRLLTKKLKKIINYPIISEESYNLKIEKIKTKKYWLLDPLDGSKEFINNNDEFTINLALITNNKPTLGIIYLPVTRKIYWSIKNKGAFCENKKIYNNSKRENLIATISRFHKTSRDNEFLKKNKITQFKEFGSSIKFIKLAEGIIDIYPRFNGSKEWDIAAGHLIASEAGCTITDLITKNEPKYNKGDIKNNIFICLRKDLQLNSFLF